MSDSYNIKTDAGDIRVIKAANTNDPEKYRRKGYETFQKAYDSLPKQWPPILFHKTLDEFPIEKVVVAINDNKDSVVGSALLQPYTQYPSLEILYLTNASEILYDKVPDLILGNSYILSSVSVDPDFRHKGFGTKLIAKARELTNNQCMAFITNDNEISKRAFEKAGFVELKGTEFISRFYINGDDISLDANGDKSFEWKLFYTPQTL